MLGGSNGGQLSSQRDAQALRESQHAAQPAEVLPRRQTARVPDRLLPARAQTPTATGACGSETPPQEQHRCPRCRRHRPSVAGTQRTARRRACPLLGAARHPPPLSLQRTQRAWPPARARRAPDTLRGLRCVCRRPPGQAAPPPQAPHGQALFLLRPPKHARAPSQALRQADCPSQPPPRRTARPRGQLRRAPLQRPAAELRPRRQHRRGRWHCRADGRPAALQRRRAAGRPAARAPRPRGAPRSPATAGRRPPRTCLAPAAGIDEFFL
jgi:hypothetical protein